MKKSTWICLIVMTLVFLSVMPTSARAANTCNGHHQWDNGVTGKGFSYLGGELCHGGITYTCKVCGEIKNVEPGLAVTIRYATSYVSPSSDSSKGTMPRQKGEVVPVTAIQGDWIRILNEWYKKDCFSIEKEPVELEAIGRIEITKDTKAYIKANVSLSMFAVDLFKGMQMPLYQVSEDGWYKTFAEAESVWVEKSAVKVLSYDASRNPKDESQEIPPCISGEHNWDAGFDSGYTVIGGEIYSARTVYTCTKCGATKTEKPKTAICTASCHAKDLKVGEYGEYQEKDIVPVSAESGNWVRICNKWYPRRCFYILDGENNLPVKGGQIRVTETTKVKPDEAWSREISQDTWPTVKAGTVRNAYRECGNYLEIKLNGKSYWIETAKTEELAAKGVKKVGQGILTVTTTMYREARVSAGARGTLKEGTVVNIYEEKGAWVKILKNGVYAWIKADAVYNTASPAPTAKDRVGQGTATQKMTIYEQPSTKSAKVGTIAKGSVRNLYAQCGNWYQIYVAGKYAWVRCDGFEYTKSAVVHRIGTAMVKRGTQKVYYGPSLETESRDLVIPTYSKINVYAQKGTMFLVYRGGRFMWMSNQSITQFRQ